MPKKSMYQIFEWIKLTLKSSMDRIQIHEKQSKIMLQGIYEIKRNPLWYEIIVIIFTPI